MFAIANYYFTQVSSLSVNIMFSKVSTLLLLVVINCFVSYTDGFSRVKRADIDLQTCIDNFDVHRDKIIRTQDSQNMGAKYLNEIDLGTREECLRLCCETDNCDVFVFEEKNSGSCYLFHCGPPEDFKCKFTHHVNYSSAVLAVSRHLPDLESQIKLTKHEQDLSKLRKPESEPEVVEVSETRPLTSTTSTTTIKSQEVFSAEMKTKPPEEGRKCRRYQFECRSTSECIAIYNACDGIPQCADGSDEAPELGCPDSPTTSLPPPIHANSPPVSQARYDSNIPPSRIHPLPQIPQPDLYRPQLSQDSLGPSQVQAVPHQDPDFLRPVPNVRNNLNSRVQYDSPPMPQYAPAPVPVQPNWASHQPHEMQPQMPQYPDKNSHIFNHKENGLQVPDGQEISQMQYNDGRDQYNPKISNYYDSYRQPVQQENWANNDEVQYNGYPQEQATNTEWHQINPNDARKDGGFKTTSPDHTFGSNKENPKHEQDKMAHELKHSKDNVANGVNEQDTKIKIEKHTHTHHDHYPDVVAYKMDGTLDLQDGAAETASGAVLSLTLGLIITCIMALLIGCRLRVKRRMRKGGKSYAHDADYLVNGMYL